MNEDPMNIPGNLSIRSPSDLESLLVLLSRLLDAGVLRQCEAARASQGSIDLRTLRADGPWPDILEAEFVSADGRRYELFVDTYHGTGGRWRVTE
jgi:hypothetical protein